MCRQYGAAAAEVPLHTAARLSVSGFRLSVLRFAMIAVERKHRKPKTDNRKPAVRAAGR
ncbi:MAG TPA: hypothetical protein VF618_07085 [Thermoanaerobaculia bacterium]